MSGEDVLQLGTTTTLVILTLALLLTIVRLVRGPTLPDRILALDMIASLSIGFIATIAIRTGFTLYLDIAISMGLVGFLSTVALARFVLKKAGTRDADAAPEEAGS